MVTDRRGLPIRQEQPRLPQPVTPWAAVSEPQAVERQTPPGQQEEHTGRNEERLVSS
jgi:hypothetical protein